MSACRYAVGRKLDRLGCSPPHLVETVRDLIAHGLGFNSLQEHIDIMTSDGKLIFHILTSLAEFERDMICERTKAGGIYQPLELGVKWAAGQKVVNEKKKKGHLH